MDVSLDSNILEQLSTKEAKTLHCISDDLSACGVGKIVNLPQIIVVGEQSAGKSLILEAISHIRFPVDGSLCTRFATELVFHHADETRIDASVRFADKNKPSQAFRRTKFHEDDLPGIIKEAKEHMGFSRDGNDFSKDVLRLEIEGPNVYPLSLVDLPGLYHTNTEKQSLGGRDTVDELVESYMRQKNSIILVVVAANINLASHAALEKAKTIDPQRRRTIGVIAKPDLALTANAKDYIKLTRNQESAHKLQLGWHVLRNRGEDEISLKTRDEMEESFFQTRAWATIPDQDRGILNFRRKLSGILFSYIRNSLPGVIEEIETKLRDKQADLIRLGDARSDYKTCRSYMLAIASDFQRLARDGCNGRYNDPFFGGLEDEDLKFRALLRNFNRVFDHILRSKGSTQNIVLSNEDKPKDDELPQYLARFLNQYPYDFQDPERITVEELSIKLESKAAANQGREFPGSPNVDLAMQLFKKQASPWKHIAQFHVDTVATVAKAFVD
jgi:GTPase SAR1 family protein